MTEYSYPWAKSTGGSAVPGSAPAHAMRSGRLDERGLRGPRLRASAPIALGVTATSNQPSSGVLPARRQVLTS